MGNRVKDWWEKCHEEEDIKYISGTPSGSIWAELQIVHLIKGRGVSSKKVLNIGVGTGVCTRALYRAGHTVDVLDISEKAIEKGKATTNKAYRPDTLHTIDKNNYDLVISHLVMQHMSDEDVNHQLKHVIPSLKKNEQSLFAFQFASYCDHGKDSLTGDAGAPRQTIRDQQRGGVCRSPEYMRNMVYNNKGKIPFEGGTTFSETTARWGYFHVVRADVDRE